MLDISVIYAKIGKYFISTIYSILEWRDNFYKRETCLIQLQHGMRIKNIKTVKIFIPGGSKVMLKEKCGTESGLLKPLFFNGPTLLDFSKGKI